MNSLFDLNVLTTQPLPSPAEQRLQLKPDADQTKVIRDSRKVIEGIISGTDKRHLVVVGPCSIHDQRNGLDYAKLLAPLARELSDKLYIVMRVYFEKPRTSIGWKGLIMDPHLDGTSDIATGLELARGILLDVLSTGLPTATELLDPITPQYIADLLSWSAIGARTTESQTHRQMASGLSMPLGFKNTTSGDIQAAINAIKAASQPQTFLGVDNQGKASAVTTRGNAYCHVVLRGGADGPNHQPDFIKKVSEKLSASHLKPGLMVDCSHANCGKDPVRQADVFLKVISDIVNQGLNVFGTMVESHLLEGSQKFPQPRSQLKHGLSITDPCIGWEKTEEILRTAHSIL